MFPVYAKDIASVSETSKAVGTHNYDYETPEGQGKIIICMVDLSNVDPDGDATNGTLAITLKESDDGTTWTDIIGGASGTLSAVGAVHIVCLKDRAKSHIRVEAAVGTDVVNFSFELIAIG